MNGIPYDTDLNQTPAQAADIARPRATKPDSLKRSIVLQVRVTKGESEMIDRAAAKDGYGDRSSFVRSAINRRLDQMGIY